ncbi:MAG: YraN family protein, partial [Actinomycetota bacterium]
MHERALLGRSGEDLAAAFYERQGFTVSRNYRCREGEIDLIAARGSLVVFCEVKTRSTDYFGLPAEAVKAALDELPEQFRTAVYLADVEG